MTEETTRLLETPEPPRAPFEQNVYEHPGSLAQPTSRISPQAVPTNRNLDTTRKPTNWVLVGSLLFASLALIATVLFLTLRNRTATTVAPPVVVKPQVPPVNPPPIPPIPQPPGTTQGGAISKAYVYPGAETTMEITDATEGNVLQLHTSDSLDKVVAWYTEKLKPTQTIKQPSNVILGGGGLTAIINGDDDGTNIMLTHGED